MDWVTPSCFVARQCPLTYPPVVGGKMVWAAAVALTDELGTHAGPPTRPAGVIAVDHGGLIQARPAPDRAGR